MLTDNNVQLIVTATLASFNYGYSNNVIAGSFAQVSFGAKFLSGSNATALVDAIVSGYEDLCCASLCCKTWPLDITPY